MATVTHKVVRGDTLSALAKKYGTTVNAIAKLNNIKNVNLIYVGQVLTISGKSSSSSSGSSSSSSSKTTSSKKVKVIHFGEQSNSDRLIFVTWDWTKDHTEHYKVKWWYATGDGVWFVGNESEVKDKQSTYTPPANATKVRVKIKPISTTKKVNKKDVNYWTAEWSTEKIHEFSKHAPSAPNTPTVSINKYKLTASLDNISIDADKIEFQIVKNDKSVFKTGTATISKKAANYSCTIDAGANYKVRCRGIKNKENGDWSEYSEEVSSVPNSPKKITTCKAASSTSIYIKWEKATGAKSYDIEYTKEKHLLGNSNGTTIINEVTYTSYDITGLESGEEYFVRVRAVNEQGKSGWTDSKQVKIGKPPEPPTTWSNTTTAVVGDDILLYWMHNSTDNSHQTKATLELTIDGITTTTTIDAPKYEDDEEEKTSEYIIGTDEFEEGATIKWRVRTAGITGEWSSYSTSRTIKIYAPPSLELFVVDSYGEEHRDVITTMPFSIEAQAGPDNQTVIGYHVVITNKSAYETVDAIGNTQIVPKNSEVFSRFYDQKGYLNVDLGPSDIDLENNVSYKVTCTVSMNSGLTATEDTSFKVAWEEEYLMPNAEIGYDPETFSVHINPYCEYIKEIIYEVIKKDGKYIRTNTILDPEEINEGFSEDDIYTEFYEDIIYKSTYKNTGTKVYFCIPEDIKPMIYTDATLAVYRREFDGRFILIGEDIPSVDPEYVTDPHPSLDYARYRIVAKDNYTGAISYADIPGLEINEKSVIIQWDEEWSNFQTTNEDELEVPVWSGSLLKLPYNIDISDDNSVDVSLIEYIGRERPVSYYGTHKTLSSTWKVAIKKDDYDTLYALRRLSVWLDDVYIREPSGSGYWASISVSFSQVHCDLTIPVTIKVTRVDGGV